MISRPPLPASLFITAVLFFIFGGTGCVSVKAQPGGDKKKPSDYGIESKKALDLFLTGMQQIHNRDYEKGFEYFDEAIKLEPNFGEANFNAGGSCYILQRYEKAKPYLLKAKQYWKDPSPMLYYYIAEVYFLEDSFSIAKENYKIFLDAKPVVPIQITEKANKHYQNAQFATEAMMHPVKFELVNLGEAINTREEEYLPYLTADGTTIFFTSRRESSTGGYSAEYHDFTEDFFSSEFKDNQWQPAKNLGAPVNTEMNEGAACFTSDGQWVYFTSCSRKGGFGDCDIWASKLTGTKWSEPKNLGPIINTDAWESQPCMSQDGNTLYFSSNRPGGMGGMDIWYIEKTNGIWGAPKNAGAPINTRGQENCPFLHADGSTLYFSSDFHPGMGQMDLFLSRKIDGKWSQPENLGYPINSSAVEANIFINPAGDLGFVNSARPGGFGKKDIYSFKLDPKIRPSFTTFVRGNVMEDGTKTPLSANVTFINLETRDTIRSVSTNELSGKFLLSLPVDQDYAAFVDAKGYLFASRNFSLKGLPKNVNQYYDLDILLVPIREGASIILNNIFYETAKYNLKESSITELMHIVKFMKQNPTVKIEIGGHTDNVGTDTENQLLSDNRSGEVKKYLVGKGVSEARIVAKGYGEKVPIDTNDTEDGRAKNRRTEFRILSK